MPSSSKKQHNLMAMVAHDPAAAKRLGIPQKVGKDFVKADTGRKFAKGGPMAESKKAMEQRHAKTLSKIAKEEASEAKEYRCGGKVKKYAEGDEITTMGRTRAMPSQSNKGGAMRGLARAAAMSGRTMPSKAPVTGGPLPPAEMKKGGKVKKYAMGGAMPMPPAGMPSQANFGGAATGLDRAAAMSGRTMPTTAGTPPTPAMPSIPTAQAMTPTMKKGGSVKKFSAGGFTRSADGIAKKGKTRGKYI